MRVRFKQGSHDYSLWIVHPNSIRCEGSGGKEDSCLNGATKPTGIAKLVNDNNEWGLTKDDIALTSFFAHNRTGLALPLIQTTAKGIDRTQWTDMPYGEGMRTPGMYKIPTCHVDTFHRDV